jgi:hypothetical protein
MFRSAWAAVLTSFVFAAMYPQAARSAEPLETVTVIYEFDCPLTLRRQAHDPKMSLEAALSGLTSAGGYYNQSVPLPRNASSVTATFRVLPDAYYLSSRVLGGSVWCNGIEGDLVVVLPGHPQTVTTGLLENAVGDAVAYANVAGLIDEGLRVRIWRTQQTVPCDSVPHTSDFTPIGTDLSGNAFYAQIPGADQGSDTVLVSITDGAKAALVVLPVKIPEDSVGANSTYRRFDITRAVVDRFASRNGAIARCLDQPPAT